MMYVTELVIPSALTNSKSIILVLRSERAATSSLTQTLFERKSGANIVV